MSNVTIQNERGWQQEIPESAVAYWTDKGEGWQVVDPQPPTGPGEVLIEQPLEEQLAVVNRKQKELAAGKRELEKKLAKERQLAEE